MSYTTKFVIAMLAMLLALFAALFALSPDASADECVPSEAWTETVLVTPGRTETVVVTPGGWQRWSWTGGPYESDEAPPFPSEDWQANVAGDPHGVGVPGAYYRSHGSSGKGDWFYLEAIAPVTREVVVDPVYRTVEHPEVTCDPTAPDPRTYIEDHFATPSCEVPEVLSGSVTYRVTPVWDEESGAWVDGVPEVVSDDLVLVRLTSEQAEACEPPTTTTVLTFDGVNEIPAGELG